MELLRQIAQIRKSVRQSSTTGMVEDNTAFDIRMNTLLKWADSVHFDVHFDFGDIQIPQSAPPRPATSDPNAIMAWAKAVLRATRLAKGIGKVDMDVLLEQQLGVYNSWELRTGFTMTAMQRVVRALGGVFTVHLEHRHNPGLTRRLAARKR